MDDLPTVSDRIAMAGEPAAPEAGADFGSRERAPHQVPRFVELRRALPRSAVGRLPRARL
jgi:hypothetical protein